MQRDSDDDLKPWMRAALFRELEAALIEYVERYGPTERARALLIAITRAIESDEAERLNLTFLHIAPLAGLSGWSIAVKQT